MDLRKALTISAHGMDAQGKRLRVIAENLASQDTTGSAANADADSRKTVGFDTPDRGSREMPIRVEGSGQGKFGLPLRHDPSHPPAKPGGDVKTSDVNSFAGVTDMREAEPSYSANLAILQTTRGMLTRTISMLK